MAVFTLAGDMRPAFAIALLTLLPTAHGLGLGPTVVEAEVDLPFLAPMRVEDPLPVVIAQVVEARAPPEPLVPRVDGALHAPRFASHVEPPRLVTGPAAPLARAASSASGPALVREPTTPPRALDREPSPSAPLPLARRSEPEPAPEPEPVVAPALAPADPQVHRVPIAPQAPPPAPQAWALGALALVLAPWLLYHHRRAAATDRGTRAQILDLLRERPGLSRAEIARAVGVDPTTARYHLHRLARAGLVAAEGAGGRARYFAADAVEPSARVRLAALHGRAPILAEVQRAPGLPKARLSAALSISRASVDWHLRALSRAGIVRLEKEGRSVRVFPISF